MKLTRRQKETIGFSLLLSAAVPTAALLLTVGRRRGLPMALAAAAAVQGVAGYLFLTDPKPAARKKNPPEERLFTDSECRMAEAHIRRVLGGRHDEEAAPRVLREIPRDEDATEEDFQ